jgi:RNA polymerase sigma factor (sigma-70 family)
MEALRFDFRTVTTDDAVIVRSVLAGEKAMFEILMRRHNQTIYRIIRGYLKGDSEIKDVMQNTYLKAFDKLEQFRGVSKFSTWLIRIAINESLLFLQSVQRHRVSSLDDVAMEGFTEKQRDKNYNPEGLMIQKEASGLFERAVDDLPEKYKAVFLMKEVEGMSYEEMADILNISATNLKVRVHRAKTMLKDNLMKMSVTSDLFQFGSTRCDAVVSYVMARV